MSATTLNRATISSLFLVLLLTQGGARAQNDKSNMTIVAQPSASEMQAIAANLKKKTDCLRMSGPIKPSECSNGCGPEWLVQKNRFPEFAQLLNNREFRGRIDGTNTVKPYPIDFSPACNLHDIGYGGGHVYDEFDDDTDGLTNFTTWARGRIDKKFHRDLARVCERTITDSKEAREKCKSRLHGGAALYKDAVEKLGFWSYDCNLILDGFQNMGCNPTRQTYWFWNTEKRLMSTATDG